MKQAKIMLEGDVQRVGLRESIKILADRLGLVGQVMNLKSGRVRVVCEGAQDSIDRLVGKLRGSPGLATVNSASVSYSEPEGEYDSFVVVRGDERSESAEIARAGVDQLKIMTNILHTMNETNKEGFRRNQEGLRGIDDKLNTMNETNKEGFRRTQEAIQGVKKEIQGVKKEIQGVRKDTRSIKEEIQGVRKDTRSIKEDTRSIKEDTRSIKEDRGVKE